MPPRNSEGPANTFSLDGTLCERVREFAEKENRTFANAAKTLILRGLTSTSKADAKWVEKVTRKRRRAAEELASGLDPAEIPPLP